MPPALILELLKFALPLVAQIRAEWKAAHSGAEPTDADVLATFTGNVQKFLDEGAAWRATHPLP